MRVKQIIVQVVMTLIFFTPLRIIGQGAAPSSHLFYSGGNTNSDIWMNSVMVPVTTTYTYYSVMGWNTGYEGGGYCGIQDHPNGKLFIFSLWDPSNHLPIVAAYTGPGTQIENFGGEGTGLKSWNFSLGWSTNTWYNLVTRVWQQNGHTFFGFWSQDMNTGRWTHLVTMDYPVANVSFKGNNDAFIEDWFGSGANIRKVLYKNGWQRSTSGTWKLQKAATFSSNSGDAVRNGQYNEAFNAGIENGSFFMQTGGNTTHSFSGRTTNLSIASSAITPATVTGEISSFVSTYNPSTKYVNVAWDVNQVKSPQFSYTFEVFSNAQFTGSPLVTVTNNIPQARSLSANLSSLANGVYYTRFKIKDIFDNVSAVKTSEITIGGGPLVSFTSPVNNAQLDLPVSTLLKANASSSGNAISKVEFYQDNTKLGEDYSSPYEVLWTTSMKGTYNISAVAYDSQGNTGSAEITVTADYACTQLTGTAFGTSPAYLNGTSTFDKAFDGDISTFFDYAQANGGYAGLDLGSAKVINGIRYFPRTGQNGRMNGGKFQASNVADFSSGVVDLYIISGTPSMTWYQVNVTNSNAYRYVRYLSPDGGYCNVAEVQFCGTASSNQLPTVSITTPANGATYTAPGNVTITATATDTDGTISKVEFYNGTTLLNSDNTSPYSYTWTGVAAGTYTLTTKAYDNSGAVVTSPSVSITVNSSGTCTAAMWNATTPYSGGAIVQYGGIKYKANWWTQNNRPDLNNGGSGSGMPWTSLGTCTSKMAAEEMQELNASFSVFPNPANDLLYIQLEGEVESVEIIGTDGILYLKESNKNNINISSLASGLYVVKVEKEGVILMKKFSKQ